MRLYFFTGISLFPRIVPGMKKTLSERVNHIFNLIVLLLGVAGELACLFGAKLSI
jgi:hypothetical protein